MLGGEDGFVRPVQQHFLTNFCLRVSGAVGILPDCEENTGEKNKNGEDQGKSDSKQHGFGLLYVF